MVGATYYYADANDEEDLLDYLESGTRVTLRRWPLHDANEDLTRAAALSTSRVLVVSSMLGEPAFIGKEHPATREPTASGVFNLINLESARRAGGEAIVDFNVSPVLFWQPGSISAAELRRGSIGTQADSPKNISAEYDQWIKRVASWIRRRGTPVWGLEGPAVRPDLNINIPTTNSTFALPGALRLLEAGAVGRE